jgi:RNA polymerase sigma factor (sigma-70 family)
LQSDERLVALTRRGNQAAFEALVARYQARLLAFCRHMLSSKEDAEDVLQEVFAAAFNAMLADERAINVRPWLYRIARNRSLNHLRRTQAVGVDSMDIHLSEGGVTTADKVHKREEFRLLVADVQDLPETQRTALLLREIDALSYEQIADAMETTVPSVKSLLVRARVSLAEAAEARLLTCDEVRDELGEVAEGLRRTSAPVRRHLRTCDRCTAFRKQLRETNKALAAIFPVAPLLLLKKTLLAHLGTTAAASSGTAAAAGGGTAAAGAAAGGMVQAGASALATKAAAGLAAAAIVTAGAVEAKHVAVDRTQPSQAIAAATPAATAPSAPAPPHAVGSQPQPAASKPAPRKRAERKPAKEKAASAPAKTDTGKTKLVAAVTPLREQREGDTTTPTDTSATVQPTDGTLPPGQSAPPQGQPAPPPEQPQPSPQPTPTPGDPSPQPTFTPTPEPSPTPSPSPFPTPTPGATPTPTPDDPLPR